MTETPRDQQKQRRARRLSAALRDNLKRRKAQVRARQAAQAATPALAGRTHDSAGFAPDKPKG